MAQLMRHRHGKRYSKTNVGFPDDIQVSVSMDSIHIRIRTGSADDANIYHVLEIEPDEWDRAVAFVESVRARKAEQHREITK